MKEDFLTELTRLGHDWLNRRPHNIQFGEWWYATIKRTLYLEEEITKTGPNPIEFQFYTLSGKIILVHCISLVPDEAGNIGTSSSISLYDKDYNYLRDVKIFEKPNPSTPKPPDYDTMLEAARAIGSQFDFARIDFYNPEQGVVYLGEITMCPGGGTIYFTPEEFDRSLAAGWDMNRYVRKK